MDYDSDAARLDRHRRASSMWPTGRPATHAERHLETSLNHLDKVLNGCRSSVEQEQADTAAREWLKECGR